MRLIISKVSERLFDGEAYSLTAPGVDGELTVLSNHMPLVTNLKKGELRVRVSHGADIVSFPVERGILEVAHNSATVLL